MLSNADPLLTGYNYIARMKELQTGLRACALMLRENLENSDRISPLRQVSDLANQNYPWQAIELGRIEMVTLREMLVQW